MKQILLSLIDNSRNYTIAVAQAIPSRLDAFRPTEDIYTTLEQLHHLGYGIRWWMDNQVREVKTEWRPPALPGSREEVMEYVERNYSELASTVPDLHLTDENTRGFFATLDHITHHRGQLIIYLRCNGIPAPEYTY